MADQAVDGGTALALFLARLDRDRQVLAAGKGNAQQHMRNVRAPPIDRDQVEPFELAQVEALDSRACSATQSRSFDDVRLKHPASAPFALNRSEGACIVVSRAWLRC